jgi:uncharacterized protein (TIGR02266 family)
MIVMQVKIGDPRSYFFGYATNISASGIFIQTVSPRDVGSEFEIEFAIPKTEISTRCRARVVWSRKYSSGKQEPGMGLQFLDLDSESADRIEDWVIGQPT